MKSRRFLIVADPHGDMIDSECRKSVFEFKRDWKPEIGIHAGDNWDFRNLRRGATDDEKAESLVDDWEAGAEFIREFFDGVKTGYFLRGNHDERLWHFADSASGLLRDYATDGIKRVEGLVRQSKAKMLPYDSRLGVLDIGKLRTIHGYATGIGAAARHARIYGNCFYGHTHDTAIAPVENLDGPSEARGIGPLCKLDMPYNSAQTNKLRHQNAWVYGLLFEDGTYQAFQAKRINGRFACASEIQSY